MPAEYRQVHTEEVDLGLRQRRSQVLFGAGRDGAGARDRPGVPGQFGGDLVVGEELLDRFAVEQPPERHHQMAGQHAGRRLGDDVPLVLERGEFGGDEVDHLGRDMTALAEELDP